MVSTKPSKYLLIALVVGAIFTAVVLGVVLVGGLTEGTDWYRWWPHISMADIKRFVKSSGHWGVGASISLMVLHSFVPFPAELVAIANGMIYGPIWGTVITWIGAMLGAFLAFGLSRKIGRPFVRRMLTNKRVRKVDDWLARYGAGALLFSRFIPVIAFNLINYAAGLTKISWWTFGWMTGVGILPLTTLMVVMGDQIETLSWQVWLLLLAAGLVLWLITHRLVQRSRGD
ncbi:MAG: TVP38/TMEM64 family protein [Acidiferrobacterales bacterium]